MATEYKLNYTASEINEKLGKVDEPVSWNDLKDKPFGEETDGTIKPLDEKYLPESVKGGGQCDWNTMANKPFGEIEKEYIVKVSADSDILLDNFPKFAAGDTVTITVNDVEYSLVAVDYDGEVVVEYVYGEGDDSPAWGIYIWDDNAIFYSIIEGYTVRYVVKSIETIDKKYLPEHLQFGDRKTIATVWSGKITTAYNDYNFIQTEESTLLEGYDIFNVYANVDTSAYLKFNGVEYNIGEHLRLNYGGTYIGNASLYNTTYMNTGEPFCYSYWATGNITLFTLYTEEAGTFDVEFYRKVVETEPLDEKYLPESVKGGSGGGGYFVINLTGIGNLIMTENTDTSSLESYEVTIDKTCTDIETAIENGLEPIVIMSIDGESNVHRLSRVVKNKEFSKYEFLNICFEDAGEIVQNTFEIFSDGRNVFVWRLIKVA